MKRIRYYLTTGVLLVVSYLLANGLAGLLIATAAPVPQESLHQQKIYAYRDWQSVGVQVHEAESVTIQASGEWLYTPGDYHGPAGHPIYLAPDFYPIAGVAGGVLIGKIGEDGIPFVVGSATTVSAYDWQTRDGGQSDGFLYLRINDDVLSDNKGSVTVAVTVNKSKDEYATFP